MVIGTAMQGRHDGSDREDYFKVTLSQGGLLTFRLTSVPSALSLALGLWDNAGNQIVWADAKGWGGTESAAAWVPAGDFFCRVYRGDGTSATSYVLTASFMPVVDPYEPNDTFAAATPLISGVELADPWIYFTGDVDYYRIELSVASQLNVQIRNMRNRLNWACQLFDHGQSLIHNTGWVNAESGDQSRDNWFDLAPGTYYLKVFGYDGHGYYDNKRYTTQPYALRATVQPAHDPNEPNNTFATAAQLTGGVPLTNGRVYLEGDLDFYRFDVVENSQVDVKLSNFEYRDWRNGAYRFRLYDAAQQLLYETGLTRESRATFHLGQGTYYVYLSGWDGPGYYSDWSPEPYSVVVDVTPYPDPREPNNDFAAATSLTLGLPVSDANLYLGGDTDFYKFTAAQQGTYDVLVHNVPPDLSVDLQLLDSSYNSVAAVNYGYWERGLQALISRQLQPGDYFVKVSQDYTYDELHWSPSCYKLLVSMTGVPELDSLAITPGTVTVDPGYAADFLVEPQGSGGSPVPFPGNVSWEVVAQTGNGTVATNHVSFNHYYKGARFTATQSGTVLLRATVGGKTAEAAITIPTTVDPHEPNGSIYASTPLEFGVPVTDALLFPNNDVDYYELVVDSPGWLRADLTSVGANLNAVLGLRNSTGGDLGTVNASGAGGNESLLVNLTGTGTFYLAVWSDGNASRASSPPYHLQATLTPINDAHEVNNSFESGGTPLTLGTPLSDAFVFPAKDPDYYVFDVSEPGDLTFQVMNVAGALDVRLNVANVSKQWLNPGGSDTGGYGQGEAVTLYLDAPGTYWGWVGARDPDSSPSPYTVKASLVPLTSIDPYERNDTLAQAKVIQSGATISDSMIFRDGDVDFFRVAAPAGEFTALLTDLPPNVDAVLKVYNSSSQEIASVDRFYAGQSEFLQIPAVAAGDYYVRVSAGGWARASYKLGVNTAFGRLNGMVSRPGGSLLAGATVTASQGGVEKARFDTGADGAYQMIVAPGTYDVSAEVPGFAKLTQPGKEVQANQDTVVDFALTDNQAPTIVHVPITQAKTSRALEIAADVTDNVSINSVDLFYRQPGESAFNEIAMTRDQHGNTYRATIPGAAVTENDLEYYIEAADAIPNASQHPATAPGTPHSVDVMPLTADFSDDGYVDYRDLFLFAPRWHTGPTSPNWDPIFDLIPGPDPALGQPDEHIDFADLTEFTAAWHTGTPPSRSRAVTAGAADMQVALDLDPSMPGIQNITPLKPGAELEAEVVVVGADGAQGFHVDLAFDAKQVEIVSQDGAIAGEGTLLLGADQDSPVAFFADGTRSGAAVSVAVLGTSKAITGTGVLAALRFRVKDGAAPEGGIRLDVSAALVSDSRGAVQQAASAVGGLLLAPNREATPADWQVCLSVTAGDSADRYNLLGVSADPTSRAASEAIAEPAWLPGSVSLAFAAGQDEPLRSTDVRPPIVGKTTWEVVVTAPGEGETVTLSWSNLGEALPRALKATLVDPVTGERVYMPTQTSYTYRTGRQAGPETRRFQIEVEPRGSSNQPLIGPVTVTPTRGRGYAIAFSLSAESAVRVEIVAPNGRPVQTVDTGRAARAGMQTLTWNGAGQNGRPVPRGIYLVRVTARSEERRQASAVRPVPVR